MTEEATGPVYACGEYDAQGNLIRATKRYPVFPDRLDPQSAAEDIAAGAAAPYAVLVWENPDVVPATRLEDAEPAQGQAGVAA